MKNRAFVKKGIVICAILLLISLGVTILCTSYHAYRKFIYLPMKENHVLLKIENWSENRFLELTLKEWEKFGKKNKPSPDMESSKSNLLGEVTTSELLNTNISIFDVPVGHMILREENMNRSDKEISADFASLLKTDLGMNAIAEPSALSENKNSDKQNLTVSFDDNTEPVEIIAMIYAISVDDSGTVTMPKEPAATLNYGKGTPEDNYIASLFVKEPAFAAGKPACDDSAYFGENSMEPYSGYCGVRLICKWQNTLKEYVFVYHT